MTRRKYSVIAIRSFIYLLKSSTRLRFHSLPHSFRVAVLSHTETP